MLLAFDTATPLVTAALADGDRVLAEAEAGVAMKHGEQLAPLIDQVLGQSGVDRCELTALAVGVGPGPFTGLRVGLVTARTLGMALRIPVYGVCTLDVIAAEVVAGDGAAASLAGGFAVATDARRKEVYFASYDERGARVHGPMVDSPTVVATDRPVAGEGPLLYPSAFPHALSPTRPNAGRLARVVAAALAGGGWVELLDPAPLYLRRPDAATPGQPKRVS